MLRRFSLLRSATWILASSALLAVGCGDDTAESTTTGQGGEGTGGEDAKASSGTPASNSASNSASSGDTTPQSSSASTGDGGSGAGDPGPGTGGEGGTGGAGGTGGFEPGVCGNGVVEDGEDCDGGDFCDEQCHITPGCGNGVVDAGEDCDDGNQGDYDGCDADCTVTPVVIECDDLEPLPSGGCSVDADGDAKLIIGDVLLPYTHLKGGQVAVDDTGAITCVGCDCAGVEPNATVITCPEGAISPGLINTHEHITYAQNHPYVDNTGERYEHRHEWRKGTNNHTMIPAPGSASDDQIRWGELRFLLSGATSLVGSGQVTGFLRNLDKAEQEDLDVPPAHFDVFPLGDSAGNAGVLHDSGCGYPGIINASSIAADLSYLPHVSEGISQAAQNEFHCLAGAPGQDVMTNKSSYIHGVGLTPTDYRDMAVAGASLIWSPRSNVSLYGNTAVVTVAKRMGVNIALGTDWILSGSANMFRELACASELNDVYFDNAFTRRELWQMVTVNAARSLSLEDVIGTLAEGTVADIAIYDASEHPDYSAVVDGEQDSVRLVLRGGKPIYGDTDILDELPDTPGTCNPLSQCLADKSICAQSEINKTFAALDAAAGNDYGPFFCGAPPDEPTCIPSRGEVVDGSTVYDGDITGADDDGDGIEDGDDNCPTVFNPIRPMDNGVQGDADGDDVGDACDPCPLDADVDDCTAVNPADEDGDGIPSFFDNCPFVANTAQGDRDGDDKGDACDQCPDQPNPGYDGVCAVTIYDLKTGAASGNVTLSDVLVTACAEGNGFYVQHKEGDDVYDGPENSGLYVYNPGTACGDDLSVGDRLDISGTISVFHDQIQLGFADFETVGQDSAPDPVVLTAAEASGTLPNEWEGVLARVEDVEVTDNAPPAQGSDNTPTGEFQVENSLRIDNFVYLTLPIPAEGTTYSAITGVLAFKNNNQKMEPRDAGDLDP